MARKQFGRVGGLAHEVVGAEFQTYHAIKTWNNLIGCQFLPNPFNAERDMSPRLWRTARFCWLAPEKPHLSH
jgi:hypothetical protein